MSHETLTRQITTLLDQRTSESAPPSLAAGVATKPVVLGEALVLAAALPASLQEQVSTLGTLTLRARAQVERDVLTFVMDEMADPDLWEAQRLMTAILEQGGQDELTLANKRGTGTAKELDLDKVPYDEITPPKGWLPEKLLGLKGKTWQVWRKPKFKAGKLSAVVTPDLKPTGMWTRKWKWYVEKPADTRITKADYNDESDWLVSGVTRNITQAFRDAWAALRDQRKRLGQGAEPEDDQDESLDESLTDMQLVREGSPEWERMWQALAANKVNAGLKDPMEAEDVEYGEAWQYLGTFDGQHEFRHRHHPTTKKREIVHIPVSAKAKQYIEGEEGGSVADIILDQMGGERRLRAMLGMNWVEKKAKAVAFAWPSKQPTKGNHVVIALDSDDTYSVEFFKSSFDKIGKSVVGIKESKSVKKYDGIYADGLADLFERQTGYYLTLAPRKKTEDKSGAAELSKDQKAALAQTKKDLAKVGLTLEPISGGGWKVVALAEGRDLQETRSTNVAFNCSSAYRYFRTTLDEGADIINSTLAGLLAGQLPGEAAIKVDSNIVQREDDPVIADITIDIKIDVMLDEKAWDKAGEIVEQGLEAAGVFMGAKIKRTRFGWHIDGNIDLIHAGR